jgi:MerR family mercuric resistance operon transcriptional regulator
MVADKKILNQAKLTIGALAKNCNVGVTTVRYYQQIGLLPEPSKPKHGGYRVYDESHIERLCQIRNAQSYGFSLKEIESILDCRKNDDCKSVKFLIAERITALHDQAHKLKDSLKCLTNLAGCCDGKHGKGECPLFQQLGRKND